MINVWHKNAQQQLEDLEFWQITDIDLGEYGQVSGCFGEDGLFRIDDDSKTELSDDEIVQLIDFALGNIKEEDCFFFYKSASPSDDPIDTEDYYERYVGRR